MDAEITKIAARLAIVNPILQAAYAAQGGDINTIAPWDFGMSQAEEDVRTGIDHRSIADAGRKFYDLVEQGWFRWSFETFSAYINAYRFVHVRLTEALRESESNGGAVPLSEHAAQEEISPTVG